MILSLSQISTVNSPFEEDVAAYAAAGFDAIGLWEFKLPVDDDANRALLAEHGLSVATCIPEVPSVLALALPGLEGPDSPEERIEALQLSVARLAAYEPACVACLAGPLGARTVDEGTELLIEGLHLLATAAARVGVRIGFEPVHVSQRDLTGFVNSLGHADEVLATVGSPELGILLDTYHVWDDPGLLPWISANSDRVAGLHVSDWPSVGSTDRVLPGEGISGTRGIVAALAEAGWDGALDVEIFSTPEGFWGLPVDEAARLSYSAATRLR